MTLDAVAKRAGVSRTTIHKWWPQRALLVEEALCPDYSDRPLPDSGSFEMDLESLVDEVVEQATRPESLRGYSALRAEILANPELLASTASRYDAPADLRWQAIFERAAKRGEIPASLNAAAAMRVVLGSAVALAAQPNSPTLTPRQMTPFLLGLLLGGISNTPDA